MEKKIRKLLVSASYDALSHCIHYKFCAERPNKMVTGTKKLLKYYIACYANGTLTGT